MEITRQGILTFTFVIFFVIPGNLQAEDILSPVNRTITKEIDVTGDESPELIILNFYGKSWKKPFKWTLTIKDKERVIFKHQSDDAWLDTFFADKDYVDECSDYLSCKKKYYEKDILNNLVVITDLSPNMYAYEKNNPGSIYVIARKELIYKYRVSEQNASQIIESMIDRLKKRKSPLLYVPISAVQSNFPLVYVPEVKGFVKVYEW